MRRRFFTLDVFTDRRFTGNPLAVVLDPDGLDGATMQVIAREFSLPETVFVLPPAQANHRAALRIFTPARELPFAGHPTVGTAVLLGRLDGGATGQQMVLEEGIGPVLCHVEPRGENRGYARFDLAKLPEETGPAPAAAAIAGALSLEPGDIGFDRFVPERWSAGNPFVFVPLRGRAAVERSRPDMGRWDAAFGPVPSGVFVFSRETVDSHHAFHARMFGHAFGIAEDPATGSAAAALAGMIACHRGLPDGTHDFAIEQGYAMGRPSLIWLALTIRGGVLAAASVGGEAVVVADGMIEA